MQRATDSSPTGDDGVLVGLDVRSDPYGELRVAPQTFA